MAFRGVRKYIENKDPYASCNVMSHVNNPDFNVDPGKIRGDQIAAAQEALRVAAREKLKQHLLYKISSTKVDLYKNWIGRIPVGDGIYQDVTKLLNQLDKFIRDRRG